MTTKTETKKFSFKKLAIILTGFCSCGPIEPVSTETTLNKSLENSSTNYTTTNNGFSSSNNSTVMETTNSSTTENCEKILKQFEKCNNDCDCKEGNCILFTDPTTGVVNNFCSEICPIGGPLCRNEQICINNGDFCAINCENNENICKENGNDLKCVKIFSGAICLSIE